MARTTSQVQQFILHALIPILCSLVVGFVFYQEGVLNRLHPAFQYLWSAIVASLFYYLLVYVRLRDALLGLLVLFLLTLLTTRSTSLPLILRDIVYVAAIGTSVFLYVRFFKRAREIHYAYPAVTLAGIYGLIYSLAGLLLLAIDNTFAVEGISSAWIANAVQNAAGFGLWIGFAVGAGIALAERFFPARVHKPSHGIA